MKVGRIYKKLKLKDRKILIRKNRKKQASKQTEIPTSHHFLSEININAARYQLTDWRLLIRQPYNVPKASRP